MAEPLQVARRLPLSRPPIRSGYVAICRLATGRGYLLVHRLVPAFHQLLQAVKLLLIQVLQVQLIDGVAQPRRYRRLPGHVLQWVADPAKQPASSNVTTSSESRNMRPFSKNTTPISVISCGSGGAAK